MATLTIAEIAQRLGLPESTVRYYRDHFTDYIPVIGEGRQRRDPAEAVEVFQVIADTLRKDHGSAIEVEETPNRMFPRNAVTIAEPPQTTAEQQQSHYRNLRNRLRLC
ncbi:MerR family transcriptional regulator [Sulfobacillus harzensis]|uniref:Helix-turn-helix domain-containing protein n=1 Tax=Sulfobacillus harzensis TaxID=2729629 RepID=A0A7Y0L426_9FIRM|nr:MerR family transcriptional regulator [Sulfobacillus harzensis]NMP22926.1 helix-turn-helix domain-containing protein [Sulfobacillus harzensis]